VLRTSLILERLTRPSLERGIKPASTKGDVTFLSLQVALASNHAMGEMDRNESKEQVPDDAFKGTEAFRETGVRTRLVVIDKQTASSDSRPIASTTEAGWEEVPDEECRSACKADPLREIDQLFYGLSGMFDNSTVEVPHRRH